MHRDNAEVFFVHHVDRLHDIDCKASAARLLYTWKTPTVCATVSML